MACFCTFFALRALLFQAEFLREFSLLTRLMVECLLSRLRLEETPLKFLPFWYATRLNFFIDIEGFVPMLVWFMLFLTWALGCAVVG